METSSGKLTKRAIKELHKECLEETLSVDALMQNVNRRITVFKTLFLVLS
jgi:DNA polymerase sigma